MPNKCETCRFNPDNFNHQAGGDCANCKDFSEWMELKRIDPKKCKTCFYKDNSCHYLCVECQDAKNYTPVNFEDDVVVPDCYDVLIDSYHSLLSDMKRIALNLCENCKNNSVIKKIIENWKNDMKLK